MKIAYGCIMLWLISACTIALSGNDMVAGNLQANLVMIFVNLLHCKTEKIGENGRSVLTSGPGIVGFSRNRI